MSILPRGYSLPDFVNLGIAPPPPRGALAVAPRAAYVPLFTLHDFFTLPRATTPLVWSTYLLPLGTSAQGVSFAGSMKVPMIPNPYAPQG